MSDEKKALIITDGTQSIQSIAQSISQALDGYDTTICQAEKFEGNELLPADIFFLGCQEPNLSSFSFLEEMLLHINLASRKCGVFSTNKKALDYLGAIVKDCDADLSKPLLVKDTEKKSDIENWINKIK